MLPFCFGAPGFSGGKRAPQAECGQPFAISDGTAVCREVCLIVEIEREIFKELLFDDFDVLSKDLVIEVERLLDRRIFLKVAAERHKQTGPARPLQEKNLPLWLRRRGSAEYAVSNASESTHTNLSERSARRQKKQPTGECIIESESSALS